MRLRLDLTRPGHEKIDRHMTHRLINGRIGSYVCRDGAQIRRPVSLRRCCRDNIKDTSSFRLYILERLLLPIALCVWNTVPGTNTRGDSRRSRRPG